MKVREIAFRNLYDVMVKGEYASLAMRYQDENLSPEDQGLLTQLVYGTLRNYRYLRYQWNLYARTPDDEMIAVLLDMSTYQILLLDKIPSYAAVNEAVEIAGKIKKGAYRSLVNAVLHKVADKGAVKVTGTDETDKLAIETSHPTWLVKLWQAHYGRKTAEEICWNDLNSGRIALRVNTMKTDEETLLKDSRFTRGSVEGCLYYSGNILNTDYFRNDEVIIQSQSSQQVVKSVAPKKGERILDMCAAPGTKSIQMAMETNDEADIYAIDLYPHRVELIEQGTRKYGLKSIKCRCGDARNLPKEYPLHYFDKVLLDAPCSGLGTLKHKPEIKLNTSPQDIDDIVQLQSQLLESALLMLKDGGQLTYSTCTLNRKENERQISQLMSLHPELTLLSSRTIFPFEDDSDGFYIATIKKSVIE